MEFRKMVITLYARQQKRHRCIEQSLDSLGEGEGGMIWENGIETWNDFWEVLLTLYVRQQKRHRCIEQSFGLCARGRGWDDLGEWHWNMYNIIYEMNRQSRFDAWYWMLGAGALRQPRGMVWGGRKERDSGWGARVYLWQIHVDVWQNQYNIVK